MHRIHFAMAPDPATAPKLTGTVEADECCIGGKPRNKGPHNKRGHGTKKAPVFAVVERGGDVRVKHVADITGPTLKGAIREHVDCQKARLITDENAAYKGIAPEMAGGHETVNHGQREYARGDVTTNTIESFFAILKRGITGTYHAVSKEHLLRYLAEFQFRYNARKINAGERTALAIRAAEGKWLMYRQPVAG